MAALNQTFDMSTAARFAHDSRIPTQLFWLLIGMALIAMAGLGYQLGLKGQRSHVLATLLTAVWTAVIVVILDLSAPRLGAIRTSVEVYDWILEDSRAGCRSRRRLRLNEDWRIERPRNRCGRWPRIGCRVGR